MHRLVAANIAHFKSGTFAYRETGALQPAFHRKLRTLARRFYREFCALLEQGRSVGLLAFDDTKLTALAVGSIIGFMYAWYKPEGRLSHDEMADQLMKILFKTIGAKNWKRK